MDRVIVYSQALPQTTDILQTNKFALVGQAFQAAAALGTNTVVQGLACTQSSPTPNLFVNIAPGAIYSMIEVDATAYGDLGIDTATIVKQGILYAALNLQITPPSTAGYSQVFLVQAAYVDQDTGAAVLPYFNSNNPSQPFTGPQNSGSTSQFTLRQGLCNISLVAGVAMPTGTQVTPAPLLGNIGLFAITVANGQTQITNANIAALTTAPFFPPLPQIPPGVQTNAWTYAPDTGVVNAMVATVWPIPAALVPGLVVQVKAANANTGPTTLNVNNLGAVAVHRATGAVLSSGDIAAGQVVAFMYDGTAWQILNFTGATTGTITNNFNSYVIPYAVAGGTPNALTATFTPAVTSLTAGLIVLVKAIANNTGAATLTPSGLATNPILENQLALLPNGIVNNEVLVLVYDGANWQKANARNQIFGWDNSAPPSSDLLLQIGDLATITFTNVTLLPLHIATPSGGGLFEVDWTITASNNSYDSDPYLYPNNTTYTPSNFNTWMTMNYSPSGGTSFLGTPIAEQWNGTVYPPGMGYFNFDLMESAVPTIPAKGWNQPPCMIKFTISTYTVCKLMRMFSGCQGGAAMGTCFWTDLTTAWTSLGTILITSAGGESPPAQMTGSVTIRRLA